jgi:predicted permease
MVAAWLYRCALRAFPRRHREIYGAEMTDAFERERAARGGRAIAFVLSACLNCCTSGVAERRRQRHRRLGPPFSTLDFVLAWRMVVRYPGLSIVGVFGMAVGIAIAAAAYTIISAMTDARVPLPEGERVVSLLNRDVSTGNRELRLLHDYVSWRSLRSLEDVGLTRTVQRNLIVDGRTPETVTVAEISASAFRLARVAPLRGRVLSPDDERPGAPDVILIGHDEWVRRFHADPEIVGRLVQLGSTSYAVVGVMPEGFAFPLFHSFWIPWRMDPTAYAPRSGPTVNIFGRLVAGATIESAQAELATIGQHAAAASPATHEHLRPRVLPYTFAYNDMDDPDNALALGAIQFAIVLLLVIVCVNVAILVYARTATRQGEIAVRGALGASRRRIVTQLFVEALILAGVAAAAGLGLATIALRQLEGAALIVSGSMLPFWMSLRLSTGGALYVVALTLMAAAIVGVLPALRATGTRRHARLPTWSPGSGSRMQMGRLWTALIVIQVALTVALLPAAMFHAWSGLRFRAGDPGFASKEFLTAQLLLDRTAFAPTADGERAFTTHLATAQGELERRLQGESAISDVTFSLTEPGYERAAVLAVDGAQPPEDPVDYNIVAGSRSGHLVRFNRVATDFFDAFEVPVLMGRGFQPSDAGPARTVAAVLVNRALVDQLFAGRNPLGARVRYVGRSREANERDVDFERLYEIVGVVPDFPVAQSIGTEREAKVYHAVTFGEVYPVELALRVRHNDPLALANQVRELATAIDPNLQVRDISTAELVMKREQGLMRLIGVTVLLVMASVVLLSAAGMYALMSFTVAQRRREIGIRAALGANRNRILAGIFSRAFAQLGLGAAAGLLGAVGLEELLEGAMFQGQGAVLVPGVAVLMTTVGALAAIGPARRGVGIQPTEALREE